MMQRAAAVGAVLCATPAAAAKSTFTQKVCMDSRCSGLTCEDHEIPLDECVAAQGGLSAIVRCTDTEAVTDVYCGSGCEGTVGDSQHVPLDACVRGSQPATWFQDHCSGVGERYHCDAATHRCAKATKGHSTMAKCRAACGNATSPAAAPLLSLFAGAPLSAGEETWSQKVCNASGCPAASCKTHSYVQGKCYPVEGGGSCTGICWACGVRLTVYASDDCSGTAEQVQTEPLGQCAAQKSGGYGENFCSNVTGAGGAAGAAVRLPSGMRRARRFAVSPPSSNGWERVGAVGDEEPVVFHVALRQDAGGVARLRAEFAAVTDPASPRYGVYLTLDRVRALTSAPPAARGAVASWLRGGGATRVDDLGDALRATAPAAAAAALLQTELARHLHADTGATAVHFERDYHIPAEVAGEVEFVAGLTAHRLRAPPRAASAAPDANHTYMIPATLRALYGIDATEDRATEPGATQGVAAFKANEAYSKDALQEWFAALGEDPTSVSAKGMTASAPTPETTLDLQYITTIGGGSPTEFRVVGGDFYTHASDLVNDASRPLVNSVSWGADEHDYGEAKAKRTDTEYMKLGSMGVSVFAASGDQGAEGVMGCNDWDEYPLSGGGYPASSPYVTSVGATMTNHKHHPSKDQPTLPPICDQYPCTPVRSEIACSARNGSLITTGGGFSFFATRPDYQDAAVSAYLSGPSKKPTKCPALAKCPLFNGKNRGYPDISANGNYFLIHWTYKGKPYASSAGTSCSTPVIAGMVSLLNSKRIAKGKPPLGFVNPLFYKMASESPDALTDITHGDNLSTQGGFVCESGYHSTKGWDPVTGLGTPNFQKIVAYLEANALL